MQTVSGQQKPARTFDTIKCVVDSQDKSVCIKANGIFILPPQSGRHWRHYVFGPLVRSSVRACVFVGNRHRRLKAIFVQLTTVPGRPILLAV